MASSLSVLRARIIFIFGIVASEKWYGARILRSFCSSFRSASAYSFASLLCSRETSSGCMMWYTDGWKRQYYNQIKICIVVAWRRRRSAIRIDMAKSHLPSPMALVLNAAKTSGCFVLACLLLRRRGAMRRRVSSIGVADGEKA